jgi:oxygen-dependent protoporphyrinogen oxidase
VKRVVVIGGGISGLATAYYILQRDPSAQVTLLERDGRLGGNLITERADGRVIDGGPDSWVANKPHATALAKALGLEGDLVGTVAEHRRAFIAWGERLHPIPEGFVLGVPTSLRAIARTSLFSRRAKLRMMLEPLVPKRVTRGTDDDESIGAFVGRRLGREVVERLVAPLLGGIYGGDAGSLSMRATLPQFVEMEARSGSLIHAMKATYRPGSASSKPSMFTTLRGGVGSLVDALATSLGGSPGGAQLRTRVVVARVSPLRDDARGRFAVEVEGDETLFADDVVAAVPARVAATILEPFGEPLAKLLSAIPYVSTAVVMMAFARADIAHPLDGTGYIVPRVAGRPALAATWVTSKWAGRAPVDEVLLRVFLGGIGLEHLMSEDDATLIDLARAELARSMAIHASPSLTRVYRFDRASPQPLVGHPARMRQTHSLLAATPGLHLVGAGYDGVGIPDCIRQAEQTSKAIVP